MQPAKGQQKRIASALVLAVVVAVTASSALGRSGAQRPPRLTAPTQSRCTSRSCTLSLRTGVSTVKVAPTRVAANQQPSFTAPTDNPAVGMLQKQSVNGMLTCTGYSANDPLAFQFFLGGTFRGNVVYKVTDTLSTVKNYGNLGFCLGATFSFATRSGQAKSVTLPNGLPGFAGVVPTCKKPPTPPCLASKTRNGGVATLSMLIPAVEGADPWGRS